MSANSQFSMAVHILALLAEAGDDNLKSDQIARSVNTNPVVIRRVLGQLNNAGLVVSQTGAFGGTKLAKPPDSISLREIYRAVPCGEVFALHGRAPDQDCPVGRNIEAVLCELQKEIDRSVAEKLGELSLDMILAKVQGERL